MISTPNGIKPPPRPTATPLVKNKAQQSRPQRSKLRINPFSARGEISRVVFLATVLVCVGLNVCVSIVANQFVDDASMNPDPTELRLVYFIWTFVCIALFWLSTNAFIKRWNAISGIPAQKFARSIFRLALLSPLLCIWFFIMTLLYGEPGLPEKGPGLNRIGIGMMSLFIFHLGFVAYMFSTGTYEFKGGLSIRVKDRTSAAESIRQSMPDAHVGTLTPGDAFDVHVWPYLNPLMKVAVAAITDITRARTIWAEMNAPGSKICERELGFLGVPVADCFFDNYRTMSEKKPFATPLAGLLFETRYRVYANASAGQSDGMAGVPEWGRAFLDQITPPLDSSALKKAKLTMAVIGADGKEEPTIAQTALANTMEKLSIALLLMNNIVSLIERRPEVPALKDVALEPMGALIWIGSPEVPLVKLSQDTQRVLVASAIVHELIPKVQELERAFKIIKPQIPEALAEATSIEITDLASRLKKIGSNPLEFSY